MSHSKNHYTPPGSDESLARLMNYSSLWMCQGSDWGAMMRQEAEATATQPLEKEKSNSGTLIRLEIVASIIFFGVVLLTIAVNNSYVVSAPLDTHKVQQHAQ